MTIRTQYRADSRRWWIALFAACMFASGCDDTVSVPATAPEDAARKTLDTALAAWQKGETAASMKQANPSITVAEPKWEKGQKLTKFEVIGAGEPSGAERVFQVKLWLTDENGKESQESVGYRVGTQPILTVFRSMF